MSTPRILLIDTSSSRCAVGLSGDSLHSKESLEARQSAQKILPLIQDVCASAETALAELDAVAVMAGPGSFTGLRIGVGVAQAICYANTLPAIAVSTLAALAQSASQHTAASVFCVALPAREGEYYFGAYARGERGVLTQVSAEQVATPAEIILPDFTADTAFVGEGWRDEALLSLAEGPIQVGLVECEANLDALAALAAVKFELKDYAKPADLKPNYVKEQLDY